MTTLFAQAWMPGFLAPGLAVAGVVAVSVPIIIHILSRRPRKPEPWAAMRFLLAAYKRHRTRTRLEQLILLAMRCLVLLLLGLALAGPIWSALGAMGALSRSGRVVVMIVDNSITSGAADAAGKRRFDRIKAEAGELLDALTPADRVALITASRPAAALIVPPTSDPMAVRRQIDLLEPTAAAADLRGALELAQHTLGELEDAGRSTYVAMLSDFSAGAVPADIAAAGLPQAMAKLGDMARLLMSQPADAASNVQIESLTPDRRVVLSGNSGANSGAPTPVTWTVKLRRYSSHLGAEVAAVRLTAPDAAPVRREVRFAEGQTEAEVRIDTPLGAAGLAAVEATLEPAAEGSDVVEADNTRRAVVRIRQKLAVTVLDRADGSAVGLTPGRWVTTALAPVSDQLGWPIQVKTFDPVIVQEDGAAPALQRTDAVFVLRPDLLDETSWAHLSKWTGAGGLVWLTGPREPRPALWPQQLSQAMGLTWSVASEAARPVAPLRLSTDGQIAEELARLRADLEGLLRPVEFYQHLPIARDSLGANTEVLLSGAGGSGGEPLMIASDAGRGRVLLLGSAIDLQWTNLPIKPLFVPLLHEVLRSAIDRLQPVPEYEPGDQPVLGPQWTRTTRLIGPSDTPLMLIAERDPQADAEAPAGMRPIRPFAQPGVYRSESDALVVNIHAAAANTQTIDPGLLRNYLGSAGTWQSIQPTDPASALRVESDESDLTWPLLWLVAALAIGEMILARYASHASTKRRTANVADALKPVS